MSESGFFPSSRVRYPGTCLPGCWSHVPAASLVTPVLDPGMNLPPEAALATHGRAVTLVLGGEGASLEAAAGITVVSVGAEGTPKQETAVQKPLPTHWFLSVGLPLPGSPRPSAPYSSLL